MKLLFIFVSFTLVLTSLTSKLQDMPDSALAEPLQLLLEVTRRNKELLYDLGSTLDNAHKLSSKVHLEDGLDRLANATSHLSFLTDVVIPGEKSLDPVFRWANMVTGPVLLISAVLHMAGSICLLRGLLYLRDERRKIAYARSRLEDSWAALANTRGAGRL